MFFKATLDYKTMIVTSIVALVLLSLSYYIPIWTDLGKDAATNQWIIFGMPLLNILILVIAYFFSIKSYTIDTESLIIQRPFDKVTYGLSEISRFELLPDDILKKTIRLFGSAGLFGYYGIFGNNTLKRFTLYGTQTKNFLLIEFLNGKKIVLTPDEPEAMMEALKIDNY
jgi:hypothetical protein